LYQQRKYDRHVKNAAVILRFLFFSHRKNQNKPNQTKKFVVLVFEVFILVTT